ncbi:MAG: hypothetical protein QXZ13_00270 [Candidatus Diapherotrites archaeon]
MNSLEFVLVFSFCITFFSVVVFSYLEYFSISTFFIRQNYFSFTFVLDNLLLDLKNLRCSVVDLNRGVHFD